MASPQPYRGVINAQNPRSHLPQAYPATQTQRSLQDINDQNQHLKQMIENLQKQQGRQDEQVNYQREPEGLKADSNPRFEENRNRIRELKQIISSQEQVIESYKEKFKDFQDNLIKVMKLDKDIHHRLVNPQPNPTLETNVRNVLVALNGRAPYDKLIKMIESIRV